MQVLLEELHFGLYQVLGFVLPQQAVDARLLHEHRRAHVVVVLLYAGAAARGLLPRAAFRGAEPHDLFVVLASVHFHQVLFIKLRIMSYVSNTGRVEERMTSSDNIGLNPT